jgi:hypothetical protein
MGRRALPTALALGAFVSDVAGAHAFALVALVAAIPAAFVLMLDCYGDLLAARCGPLRPFAAAAGLVLIVFSTSLRSPAVVGGVPRIAVSSLGFAVLLSAVAVASSLMPAAVRRRPRAQPRPAAGERDERLAA